MKKLSILLILVIMAVAICACTTPEVYDSVVPSGTTIDIVAGDTTITLEADDFTAIEAVEFTIEITDDGGSTSTYTAMGYKMEDVIALAGLENEAYSSFSFSDMEDPTSPYTKESEGKDSWYLAFSGTETEDGVTSEMDAEDFPRVMCSVELSKKLWVSSVDVITLIA